jgi:hypothetical protein
MICRHFHFHFILKHFVLEYGFKKNRWNHPAVEKSRQLQFLIFAKEIFGKLGQRIRKAM